MSHRHVVLLTAFLLAGCGAQPAAVLTTRAAKPAPTAAATQVLSAPKAFTKAAEADETALPAPTQARLLWHWRRNPYVLLPGMGWEPKPHVAVTVPADPRIAKLRIYMDGRPYEEDVTHFTPGMEFSYQVGYQFKDKAFQVTALDAAGHESFHSAAVTFGKAPARQLDPRVVKRSAQGLEVEWTTDEPERGYISWAKARTNGWKPTAVEDRPTSVHRATIGGLDRLTRYTLIAFARRDEDVETGRANRWTSLFTLFGPDAQMNADPG